jgi:hypothetical protein
MPRIYEFLEAEPDVVAETGPTELADTLSHHANSGLAVSGETKNNFFENYSGLAECHVPVTPRFRPAPWYRRALNGGVGGLRRPGTPERIAP